MTSLLVIIPDRLSDLVAKGEITARYYNPGNLFDDVHILMTNDDRVDPMAVQPTVGTARLHLHNLPPNPRMFYSTLGWRPWLLRNWAAEAVQLAATIQPTIVRCYGNRLNAYLASRIKRELGIPYVVSMHINPDEDVRKRAATWRQRIVTQASVAVEQIGLRYADVVLPVYEAILPYLRRMGIANATVVHNTLNPTSLMKKASYDLHTPVRIVSVGRQTDGKNPENLIRAVKELCPVHLTLIGDGPLHAHLRNLAADLDVQHQVSFVKRIPNDELCSQLPDYDLFATHTEYWEISKAVLEPLLTGLPVLLNRRRDHPVPELNGDFVLLVENSVEGYRDGIKRLIQDDTLRERLGRRAYEHAQQHWAPTRMEARVVEIYKQVIENATSNRKVAP